MTVIDVLALGFAWLAVAILIVAPLVALWLTVRRLRRP